MNMAMSNDPTDTQRDSGAIVEGRFATEARGKKEEQQPSAQNYDRQKSMPANEAKAGFRFVSRTFASLVEYTSTNAMHINTT